ncbi:T9SS type A sorting domain-containing protein [Flavilitoribacter nigricans]|uniref:Secretion system C-terminal sorting domain-containing protein n=1 Tax=Flavilitoribacter nigricans (strain ATCC 23147 / DSM 23189 / NBRC 102662 / NCIMB 1420 / SS-2) TaxID=1122177 RepID=A0A2D0N2F0_FLAN2|nr:T9SS type A sorting domain-containing protein [Flavilitoribacter nigricans]PHN02566.1 hypothetical protein CRP01_31825 [Flavilitoribacter nigricans DSM 23189 = NBRC 102662]
MKYISGILLLCCLPFAAFSQLKNDGGTLRITPGGTLTVKGDVTNVMGGTLTNEGTLSSTGGITNEATATLQGNGRYILSGDWSNAGSFAPGTSTVTFEGNTGSTLNSGGNGFYRMEMDKTTANLTLAEDVDIADLLEFLSIENKIILSGNKLTLSGTADILGFDETNYIITDGTGELRKSMPVSIPFTFPVGFNASTYNPVTLTQNGTADELGVRCLEHHYLLGNSGPRFSSETVEASWEITESVPGGSLLDISVQWNTSDELLFNRNDCAIGFWNGSSWDYGAVPGSPAAGTGPFVQSRSGIAGVGVIGVQSGAALPVEMLFFRVAPVGEMAALNWATASEINAERFDVEHSTNGFSFLKIGEVQAVGFSTVERQYDFLHEQPAPGVNYYRLRQVDLDGSFAYSEIRAAHFQQVEKVTSLLLYPNPATDLLNVVYNGAGDYRLRVFDENGRLVLSGEKVSTLDVSVLPAGVYALLATSNQGTIYRKFVVGR